MGEPPAASTHGRGRTQTAARGRRWDAAAYWANVERAILFRSLLPPCFILLFLPIAGRAARRRR